MALIAKEVKIEKTYFRVGMNQEIKSRMDAYCRWAGIEDLSHFISEAVEFVLAKDKDWQKYTIVK